MNKKELNNLLFILLIFTVLNLLLWNSARDKKKGEIKTVSETTAVTPSVKDTTPLKVKEEIFTLETPLLEATFSNIGGSLKSLKLKKYFQVDKKTPVELIPNPAEPAMNFWLKDKEYLAKAPFKVTIDQKNQEARFTFSDKNTSLIKKYKFSPDSYLINSEISGDFGSTVGFISWGPGLDEKVVASGQISPDNEVVVYKAPQVSRIRGKSFALSQIDWAGIASKYFLVSFLPQNFKGDLAVEKKEPNKLTLALKFPVEQQIKTYNFKIYAGPKNYDVLKSLGLGLEKTIDLGWKLIEPLSLGVLYILKSGHKFLGNYGILIILLTIVIKIIFHPLSLKSFESTSKMQKIQPEIKKLQEKYKNQPEKIQKELAELYKSEKINPFGGCLPVLIQIPIFFALFSTLSNSIELRGSGFMLWITDLSRPDTITHLSGIPINVLPIIMGITMFIQQKMMPMPQDNPASQQMLYLMPILMTVLFWAFPSGLVLYWLTNNIVSIGEQYLFFQNQKKNNK